jgi:hypothetical protein
MGQGGTGWDRVGQGAGDSKVGQGAGDSKVGQSAGDSKVGQSAGDSKVGQSAEDSKVGQSAEDSKVRSADCRRSTRFLLSSCRNLEVQNIVWIIFNIKPSLCIRSNCRTSQQTALGRSRHFLPISVLCS